MSQSYPVEYDSGLRRWITRATKFLPQDLARRIHDETTEHFCQAVEDLQANGKTEGAARAIALERMGSAIEANIRYIQQDFGRVRGGTFRSYWTRVLMPFAILGLGALYVRGSAFHPHAQESQVERLLPIFVVLLISAVCTTWGAVRLRYTVWYHARWISWISLGLLAFNLNRSGLIFWTCVLLYSGYVFRHYQNRPRLG